MTPRISAHFAAVAVLCLGLRGTAAHALEHVTLRTGFTYDCVRHEPAGDGRVRLFFKGTEANYVEVPSEQILSVDTLPDPPEPVSTPSAIAPPAPADVKALLSTAGAKHNIDVDLLASVIKAESGGHAAAVSHVGAQGLMQLMPGTAKELGVHDAFRPDENINGGTAYLDALLTRYHDNLTLALAAYNAGPAAVDRFHGVPPFRETRVYVNRVLREFRRRKQAVLVASR